MKRTITVSVALLSAALMTGCGGGNKQASEDFITVDATASYPMKELILQDFMDVEYIPLETNDEFLTHGIVEDIGKDILIVRNRSDGNIFIYDRSGEALRKINRLGQGAEEYTQVAGVILDEENDELFVNDYPARKLLIYDLYGNYKRSFRFADNSNYYDISDFDRDNLICFKGYSPTIDSEQSCYILISKQDGSITREINIPVKGVASPVVTEDELVVTPFFHTISQRQDSKLLIRTSADTVYNYSKDGRLTPLIARTPSIHAMDTKVFLLPTVLTDRYYFIFAFKKELDYEALKFRGNSYLVYDKQENATYKYVILNDDFLEKKQIHFWSPPENQEIAAYQPLAAHELVEAYEKGKLKGRLNEIAATLDEEANPVIMLVKYKR